MCGRYTLRTNLSLALRQFGLPYDGPHLPRYNVAPTQSVPAVRLNSAGQRELAMLHWGLIPSWAKDAKIAYSTLNARADTVATKPAFRTAYKSRRCLVIADGFYEWLREGKSKLPFLYEVDGGKPFAFAGLWESWRDPGKPTQPLESCTIITTDANELARPIHDRMPVIIDPADYDAWLHGERIPLVPFDPGRMTVRPVSAFVNNVRNQGPDCVANR
jgi:putative SOS response-associated peptidase YedK